MSECPPKKTEAELEADVDYMLDTIMADIKSGKLPMSVAEVNMRVREILKKRGMWVSNEEKKGGARKRTRRNKSKKSRSTNTRRRSKKTRTRRV